MGSKTDFLTISEALRQGTKLLEEAYVPAARLTAEVLLSHALRKERVYLFGHSSDSLTEVVWIHFGRYLHQRISGRPTQYITKTQEFFGRDFAVSPAVLIPRPETEHLVAEAISRISPGDRVLDVGCGSGAIAITLALETGARSFASDISFDALQVAHRNAERLNAGVIFFAADLLSSIAPGKFHVIVSNPPYVATKEADGLQREVRDYEPHIALFGGETGNEVYRGLIDQAGEALVPGGWLILELGWRSLEPVQGMLKQGWSDVRSAADLAGIPRVLAARRTK